MFGAASARDDEAVQVPAGEADPDPDAGLGDVVQLGGNGILERAVQVSEPAVHDNGSHRKGARGVVDGHAGTLARAADSEPRGHFARRTAPAKDTIPGSSGTSVHW